MIPAVGAAWSNDWSRSSKLTNAGPVSIWMGNRQQKSKPYNHI